MYAARFVADAEARTIYLVPWFINYNVICYNVVSLGESVRTYGATDTIVGYVHVIEACMQCFQLSVR
jgi:hypothetical protein